MAGGAQNDDEMITAINVTPLVDIVLVLLIILMVTSSYLVNKSISVELPKAATGEATETPTLSISLDVDNVLYLDGAKITPEALRESVKRAYAQDNEVKAIISADGRVHHSEVISIIDILRSEKVTKFAINTSPKDPAEKK